MKLYPFGGRCLICNIRLSCFYHAYFFYFICSFLKIGSCYWLNYVPLKFIMLKFRPLVPQNVTIFEDRAIKEAIKVKWCLVGWTLIQQDWCSFKEISTQIHMEGRLCKDTGKKDGHLQAKERCFRRNPLCWHGDLRLYNCEKIYFCCSSHLDWLLQQPLANYYRDLWPYATNFVETSQ